MKAIAKVFLAGLFTVLPIFATVYLIVWLFASTERFIGVQVRWLIPDEFYRYGMGIAAALVLIFLVGPLMRAWLFRELIGRAERFFLGIPPVRSIYAALRDPLGLLARHSDKLPMQVVPVEPPGAGMRLLGFVTRADFSDLPDGIGRDGEVAVYLPMSYMIGGYTVIVPRDAAFGIEHEREGGVEEVEFQKTWKTARRRKAESS